VTSLIKLCTIVNIKTDDNLGGLYVLVYMRWHVATRLSVVQGLEIEESRNENPRFVWVAKDIMLSMDSMALII
jgi:hypothetical protein